MKKKALALVLALAMSMALIACGQKDTPSNNANDGQSGQTDFPQKSINVIVPWNAGGGNDIAARELQPIFKDMFGVDLVIENVAGGSSAVGLTQAINSAADGYTVGFMTSTYIGLAAQGTVSSDFENDFDPICLVMEDPIAIVAKKGTYETLADFVEDAKTRPGEAIVALSNTFGTAPAYSALLNESAGIDAQNICYDSGSRCVTEVLGGHADVACSNYTDFVDQIAAGEMVCLALCTEERAASLPDVPTVNECGYDIMSLGFLRQMSFMVAPDGLDDAVKAKLCELFQQACQSDEYQEFAAGRSFASPAIVGDELTDIVNETYTGLKEAYDAYFAG